MINQPSPPHDAGASRDLHGQFLFLGIGTSVGVPVRIARPWRVFFERLWDGRILGG